MASKFISGRKINFTSKKVDIDDIVYFNENTRINDKMGEQKFTSNNISQKDIHNIIAKEDSVTNLKNRLIDNGGLLDQIYIIETKFNPHVKSFGKDYVVIEGNSRLCIYKEQYKKTQDDKWKEIPCDILTGEIPMSEIKEIMRIFHKQGKTAWRPANIARDLRDQLPDGVDTLESNAEKDKALIKKIVDEEKLKSRETLVKKVHAIEFHDEYKQAFLNKNQKTPYSAIEEVFAKDGLIKAGIHTNKKVRKKILEVMIDARSSVTDTDETQSHAHRSPIEKISKACTKMPKIAEDFFNNDIDLEDLEEELVGKGGKNNTTWKTKDFAKFLLRSRTEKEIESLNRKGWLALENDFKIIIEHAHKYRNIALRKLGKKEKILKIKQKDDKN